MSTGLNRRKRAGHQPLGGRQARDIVAHNENVALLFIAGSPRTARELCKEQRGYVHKVLSRSLS
jgi:hypothetical protein